MTDRQTTAPPSHRLTHTQRVTDAVIVTVRVKVDSHNVVTYFANSN